MKREIGEVRELGGRERERRYRWGEQRGSRGERGGESKWESRESRREERRR